MATPSYSNSCLYLCHLLYLLFTVITDKTRSLYESYCIYLISYIQILDSYFPSSPYIPINLYSCFSPFHSIYFISPKSNWSNRIIIIVPRNQCSTILISDYLVDYSKFFKEIPINKFFPFYILILLPIKLSIPRKIIWTNEGLYI